MGIFEMADAFKALREWVKANPGQAPTVGQSFGGKVWDGKALQDAPNAGDPKQQMQWALDNQKTQQNQIQGMQDDLWNIDSDYWKKRRKSFMDVLGALAPNQDMIYNSMGFDKGTSGLLASIATLKQNQKMGQMANQGIESMYGQGLSGALQAAGLNLNAGQQQIAGWGQMYQTNEEKKMQENQFWSGLLNQGLGLGGGLLARFLSPGTNTDGDPHGGGQ